MIFRTPMVMLLFGENVVIRFIIHVCHFGLKIILAVHFANKIGLLPALPDDSGVSPSVLQFSNKLHIIYLVSIFTLPKGVNVSSGYQFLYVGAPDETLAPFY